jgi:hypothetical protein
MTVTVSHLQPADANNHPASEHVHTDETHGPAGRPKQTELFEGVHAHSFRSQIWARNASARIARPCPPRAQLTEAPSHFPLPYPVFPLLRALLLLSVIGAATPTAGVRWPPPTAKKKPLLSPHPDATLGRRRPPVDGHSMVG